MPSVDRRRLLIAVGAAAVVVLSSPFIGNIRAAIRAAFPAQFRIIVTASVAAVVGAALVVAIVRIRDRRPWRFAGVMAAIVVAMLYARAVATGNPDVDVVEHVHFIEYGVLAWLFYRAWRPLDNGLALVWPLLMSVLVGIGDEFLQWFIPARVGEAHDIFIDGVAVACGLCFVASVDPPSRLDAPMQRPVIRPIARAVAIVLLAFAFFFQSVHLGHQLFDPEVGVFWSRYGAPELIAAARERTAQWRTDPPRVLHPLSREDQYLSEGLWHVQQRNLALTRDDPFTAWRENRLLELFFAPVLDTPSYASPDPPRWPAERRAAMASRVGEDPGFYMSRAAPYPIYTWSPLLFWVGVAVVIGGVLSAC